MRQRQMDQAQLLQTLTDTLCLWEPESIAEVARQILGHEITVLNDDLFEVSEGSDDPDPFDDVERRDVQDMFGTDPNDTEDDTDDNE
jgi:hypothetical protein